MIVYLADHKKTNASTGVKDHSQTAPKEECHTVLLNLSQKTAAVEKALLRANERSW
jgi:hypothetical protein